MKKQEKRRIVLSLGRGSLQTGFPAVTAHLWEAANPHPMKFEGALPAAPEISTVYRAWQMLYWAMHQRLDWHPRIEIVAADVTNVSEADFDDLRKRLKEHINVWLNAAEFHPIDQRLRTYLNTTDEICLVVETDDDLLQRLPWHLWHFFDVYPHAEVALSPSSYQRASKATVQASGRQVKILVVLGSSVGIDVEGDLTHLSQLTPSVLKEPSIEELTQALWQGCDLLFFAGHSSSRTQGALQLNADGVLTLEQLKYALKGAIARGLKLAIFNSCDGTGLARSLADLSIPQVIVMREPVPDQVAQAFLKYFLGDFVQGHSLYQAVRSAREKLQGLEATYPCASWLPVVYQNPAEPSTTWSAWLAAAGYESVRLEINWSQVPDVPVFYGREEELTTLQTWTAEPNACRMVMVLGPGGIGKTSLLVKLAEQIQNQFDCLIWQSLRHAPLLAAMLPQWSTQLPDLQSVSEGDLHNQLCGLTEYLRTHRCLIVLDNLDTILREGDFAGHYRDGYENYGDLLRRLGEEQHQSCILITSRESTREIVMMDGPSRPVRSLELSGLGSAAEGILQEANLSNKNQWEQLIRIYRGNPLVLKIVASNIRELFSGSVSNFLKQRITLITSDVSFLIEQQFQRLSAAEQELLYTLARIGEPVDVERLRQGLTPNIWQPLGSLVRRSLVEKSAADFFTLRPVVMEYVRDRMSREPSS